jgi:hypothetical protein
MTGGKPVMNLRHNAIRGRYLIALCHLLLYPCKKGRRNCFIIIISPLKSTADNRSLQLLAISLDLRLLASILRESYTTLTETRSQLQNSFAPAVVGSMADTVSHFSMLIRCAMSVTSVFCRITVLFY